MLWWNRVATIAISMPSSPARTPLRDVACAAGVGLAALSLWALRRGSFNLATTAAVGGLVASAGTLTVNGIKMIVPPTEGMPVHDALKAKRLTQQAGVLWIGGSTPGMAVAEVAKLGFLPEASLAPGPLGDHEKRINTRVAREENR